MDTYQIAQLKIFIELNLKLKKWLLSCSCKYNFTPFKKSYPNFKEGSKLLFVKIEQLIILGDFNVENSSTNICDFCATYNLKHSSEEPARLESLENPICSDLGNGPPWILLVFQVTYCNRQIHITCCRGHSLWLVIIIQNVFKDQSLLSNAKTKRNQILKLQKI